MIALEDKKNQDNLGHHSLVSQFILVTVTSLIFSSPIAASSSHSITLRMPDIKPDYADQYLCIAYALPADAEAHLLTGFNPESNSSRVHHMLIYGCYSPGIYQPDSPNFVWDCSGMKNPWSRAQSFESGPICSGEQQILYGWALDAPALKLPRDVGFKVGGPGTNIQYLVLQVHYHGHDHQGHNSLEMQDGPTDNSGFMIDVKKDDPSSGITRQAGVLLLSSKGYVNRGKSRHEIWCDIEDDIEIHPFRFRVHTHKLGTRVLGAKLANRERGAFNRGDIYGTESDVIIGERNPQDPEMFYPVKQQDLVLQKGDTVYAACEYNNNNTHPVLIGGTSDDEMCNFYLMYWTDAPRTLSRKVCTEINPREFSTYYQP